MKKTRRRHKKRRKGNDGFLRGAPEPVIVIGAYLVEKGTARMLGRSVTRFTRPGRFPCTVHPRSRQTAIDHRVVVSHSSHVAVIWFAAEEDSSKGAQALFTLLQRAQELCAETATGSGRWRCAAA